MSIKSLDTSKSNKETFDTVTNSYQPHCILYSVYGDYSHQSLSVWYRINQKNFNEKEKKPLKFRRKN